MPLTEAAARPSSAPRGPARRVRPLGGRRRRHRRPPRPRPSRGPDRPTASATVRSATTGDVAADHDRHLEPPRRRPHRQDPTGGTRSSTGWANRLPAGNRARSRTPASPSPASRRSTAPQANALATATRPAVGDVPGQRQHPEQGDLGPQQLGDDRQPPVVQIPYFDGHGRRDADRAADLRRYHRAGRSGCGASTTRPTPTADATGHRKEALHRQLATMAELAATGDPGGASWATSTTATTASSCLALRAHPRPDQRLRRCRRTVREAQEGRAHRPHLRRQPHLGQRRASTTAPSARKVTDHPLVIATTAGSSAGCAVPTGDGNYHLGPVKPQLTQLVNILAPMFDIKTVGGYRDERHRPRRPPGRAGRRLHGRRSRPPAKPKATRSRPTPGPTPASSASTTSSGTSGSGRRAAPTRGGGPWRTGAARPRTTAITSTSTSDPAPRSRPGTGHRGRSLRRDRLPAPGAVHRAPTTTTGTTPVRYWVQWHTGTDFSAPCGTPVYAAHAGTIEIDTTQGWAGPRLVKVTTGAGRPDHLVRPHAERHRQPRRDSRRRRSRSARSAQEGNATGCHLHFEVHLKNGSIYGPDNVDPSTWLREHASTPPDRRVGVIAAGARRRPR